MYATTFTRRSAARSAAVFTVALWSFAVGIAESCRGEPINFQSPELIYKLTGNNDRLELTTNTSRILTLDKNIPRVQVNNPELLAVTPLSANQVQISAKKAGVTQVNLWDEEGKIHTLDILIYGDVRELEVALQTQFPNSSIRVFRYSEALVLKGFIDQPENVTQIMQLAADYAPKVINNITVGGVQQVLLKVRVMEISRTKLRNLGVDWAYLGGNGSFAVNSITEVLRFDDLGQVVTNNADTFAFGIVDGNQRFFGLLEALEQRNIAKILAEPNITAVSGRPAQFNVGGEFPIVVPQSLGTSSIEFKKYGTQIDFLPIVLGNGKIRLEVRPTISEIDPTLGVQLQGTNVPALTLRQVDTAVEMQAGQTFALAGLVQERTESEFRGLPYISDLPIIGVPFRKTRNKVNEIELLIMVTPEFVDAMDACEVACCGPGYGTTNPTNCQLYCAGHLEVPAQCNPRMGMTACGECGGPGACSSGCCGGGGCGAGGCGCNGGVGGPADSIISDGVPLQGGTGYDESYSPTPLPPTGPAAPVEGSVMPENMTLPAPAESPPLPPQSSTMSPNSANRFAGVEYTSPRPYSPSRAPVFVRNASSPNNSTTSTNATPPDPSSGGLIGPVGYDAE
ncbi:MAG: pilus assembly protein N-terminal domain-containing protein [Pirellulales bacterium]